MKNLFIKLYLYSMIAIAMYIILLIIELCLPTPIINFNIMPKICHYYVNKIGVDIHPLYYKFFDKKSLNTKNNVIHMDNRGFRGVIPEDRGNRKLAFIIGGSSAFGWYSLSDETTISGFLNKYQDEYLFVNAGIPTYNTTEEYARLSFDLIKYKPDLIVFFHGFNDVYTNYRYKNIYDPGTYFLYDNIDNACNKKTFNKVNLVNKFNYKLFELTKIQKLFNPDENVYAPKRQSAIIDFNKVELCENKVKSKSVNIDNDVLPLVNRYSDNVKLLKNVCETNNIKPIFIFQPMLAVHENISKDEKFNITDVKDKTFMSISYQFQTHIKNINYIYDFSNLFDNYSKIYPVSDIFYDSCHITDTGNKIVAQEIIQIIKENSLIK